MSARYYNPTLGRFISPDPVHFVEGNIHSFNRYAYANNNPMKFVDPDGRTPVHVAALALKALDAAITAIEIGTAVKSGGVSAGLAAAGEELLGSAIPGAKTGATIAKGVDKAVDVFKGAKAAKDVTPGILSGLPKGITEVKNAKGEVFKEVHTPPSKPHGGLVEHTHPNYRNTLPDGSVRTGVSGKGVPVNRQDVIDATRPGAQRTGVPE
jgi:uncharacterized protein RhaS with RHS repeats